MPTTIADEAVCDEAGEPLVARHAEDEVPGHRRTGKAIGGRNDDIATYGSIQRPKHREIVGGAAVTCHGDADQRSSTWR